jgi:hypothetical protein
VKLKRWTGHALGWGLLMAFVGWFSSAPAYRHLGAEQATIKLSLRHSGQLLGACHTLSEAELARLPPTMRAVQNCPRERSPLVLEMLVGDRVVVSEHIQPRGLHQDGMASMYRRLTVPAGRSELIIKMKDNIQDDDFKWIDKRFVDLRPAQVLVIDFDAARGGFQVH